MNGTTTNAYIAPISMPLFSLPSALAGSPESGSAGRDSTEGRVTAGADKAAPGRGGEVGTPAAGTPERLPDRNLRDRRPPACERSQAGRSDVERVLPSRAP